MKVISFDVSIPVREREPLRDLSLPHYRQRQDTVWIVAPSEGQAIVALADLLPHGFEVSKMKIHSRSAHLVR